MIISVGDKKTLNKIQMSILIRALKKIRTDANLFKRNRLFNKIEQQTLF